MDGLTCSTLTYNDNDFNHGQICRSRSPLRADSNGSSDPMTLALGERRESWALRRLVPRGEDETGRRGARKTIKMKVSLNIDEKNAGRRLD